MRYLRCPEHPRKKIARILRDFTLSALQSIPLCGTDEWPLVEMAPPRGTLSTGEPRNVVSCKRGFRGLVESVVLAISTLLQLSAAYLALRLVAITRHRVAWVSIAAAILLMALRRSITLYRIFSGDETKPPDLPAEFVALAISILMLLGMTLIAPLFLEIKRSAAAADTSRRQLQAILDHTVAVVYIKDLQGRYLLANAEAQRIFGGPPVGKTDFDFFPEEVAARIRDNDLLIAKEGKNRELDETVVHPDGTRHEYLSVKFPLVDSKGQLYGVCGISTDITQRVRAAEEQRRFETQLQAAQKLESLGVLAGGIAHDFNNLLVAILGSVDLALSQTGLAADLQDDLENIQSAAEAAAGLCRQLLAYSGRGQLTVEPVDVSQLVSKMTRLMDVSTSKKAHVVCNLAPDLPLIEADATQVVQVVMNLLTNASDALGDAPGEITVTTCELEVGTEPVKDLVFGTAPSPGRYVCIRVEDDGGGMDEETKRRLFEPFYTTKFTGRGLGLSAVVGIVRGHGGAITLRTRAGDGTCFGVLLPVPQEPLQLPELPPKRAPASDQDGTLVLVVDDEEPVRRLAKKALERAGFRVILAEDGRSAVRLFRERKDDIGLVLLDLTMPEMDGAQTLQALKAIEPRVNVVLASGYDQTSATRRGIPYQASGFLAKPYTARQLAERAAEALTNAR